MKNIISFIVFFALLHTVQAKVVDYNVSHWSYSDETTNGWSNWELKNVKMSIDYATSTIYFHLNPISKYEITKVVGNETYAAMVATHDNITVEIELRRLSKTLAEMTIYYGRTAKNTPLGFRILINGLE